MALRVLGIGALVAGGLAFAVAALVAVILLGPLVFWTAWNVLNLGHAVGLPELGLFGILLATAVPRGRVASEDPHRRRRLPRRPVLVPRDRPGALAGADGPQLRRGRPARRPRLAAAVPCEAPRQPALSSRRRAGSAEQRLLPEAGGELDLEQPPLGGDAARSREAGQRAVRGEHAMAGDDDRIRVAAQRAADCAGPLPAARSPARSRRRSPSRPVRPRGSRRRRSAGTNRAPARRARPRAGRSPRRRAARRCRRSRRGSRRGRRAPRRGGRLPADAGPAAGRA